MPSLPSRLVKLIRILFPLSMDENILRQFQISLSRNFCLQSQPTCSRFLTNWSYWLSLKTERTRDHSSINTQCTAIIFIRYLLSTTLLPRSETLFHLPPINILEIFKDFPSKTRKYSKTFCLQNRVSRKSSAPENIQRLFRLQNCLSRKSPTSRKYSKTFPAATSSSKQQQQPTTAISSSNQQQQPATAINSSNQQQQSAAAISSSNHQQQSTAATSCSNQQQQPAAATTNNDQQQQLATATSNSDQQQQPAFVLPAAPTDTINISIC